MSRFALLAGVLLALTAACATEERLAPVPVEVGTTGAGGGGGTDPGPVVRTALVRSPMGDSTENFLVDGDFELSVIPEGSGGQFGWMLFTPSGGPTPIRVETGGRCMSGLRCAVIAPRLVLFARGTAVPARGRGVVELFSKPLEGEVGEVGCPSPEIYAISCESFGNPRRITEVEGPDESGWCRHFGEVPGQPTSMCLYIEHDNTQALYDAASLRAAPARSGPPALPPVAAPSSEVRARMDRIRQHLRDTMPIGSRPSGPPPRRQVPPFEAHLAD